MCMMKVWVFCLLGVLFIVFFCVQGSEKDELVLVMKQLDQFQVSLEWVKVVVVQEYILYCFYFDYLQVIDDIVKIKCGILIYFEFFCVQLVLLQDISGQY